MWRNIVILMFFSNVKADPIIIKTGIAKDHAQQQGDDVYTIQGKKGLSSYVSDLGFNKDNEGKYVSASDAGKFLQEKSDHKNHLNEKEFNDESFQKNAGGLLENFDQKADHKKGHHNSGFKNTYHKEESGTKSSFYDDSDDAGGKLLQNSRQGVYGDGSSSRSRGAHHDGSKYVNDDTRNGHYTNKGLLEKGYGNERNYNQEKYNDDRLLKAQSNAGNRFGESGRYIEENYKKPYYNHDDYYYPEYNKHIHPKRTITIYEDPRYEPGYDYQDYDRYDDPVRLDIRPPLSSHRRSYNKGPIYDQDYYY